jgi:hypothetical protein
MVRKYQSRASSWCLLLVHFALYRNLSSASIGLHTQLLLPSWIHQFNLDVLRQLIHREILFALRALLLHHRSPDGSRHG